MNPTLSAREKADRLKATDPKQDAWVAANAGSGKTRILRNRVIRLLLDGVAPHRILCLTYTRAAAAEMQTRIFAELARWVTLPDAELDAAIGDLVAPDPASHRASDKERAIARGLFARAIEAPGGLKVQTIHAFAERILHLFPIEAGVPLDFSILTDDEAAMMRREARRAVIEAAVAAPGSDLGKAFTEILDAVGLPGFESGLDEMMRELARLELAGKAWPQGAALVPTYRALFGVPKGTSLARLEARFLGQLSADDFRDAAETVLGQANGSRTQLSLADKFFAAAQALDSDAPNVARVLAPLINSSGHVPDKGLFVARVIKANPPLSAFDEAARGAAQAFVAARRAFLGFVRSVAMLTFAQAVHRHFCAAKRARSLLDFSDLIGALRQLLVNGHASWVMMKLDGGIGHVLIDEAQDTTREMWDIVSALTEEFRSGEGALNEVRTLFAVGDEKQSIYSFQGADPAVFEAFRAHFAAHSLRGAMIARPVPLRSSFRSSGDVLRAVDAVFAPPENREGLTASGEAPAHVAALQGFPGLVELWPPFRAPGKGQPGGVVEAAEAVADTIAGWLAAPEHHLVDGKPIRPGDIIVLVRERGRFFREIRTALRQAGVPMAGADQITLQEEIVVRDLLSLAQALLCEADDLALAEALRSPLFDLSLAALEPLARGRGGSLRAALRESAEPLHHSIADWLATRAEEARVAAPFDFFARLLSAPAPLDPARSIRAVLQAALGHEIEDTLNAFLNEALAYTQDHPGALLPFVQAQRGRETALKRDAEAGEDKVRVMTVHGAKGLEARIVFLADGHPTPRSNKEPKAFTVTNDAQTPCPVWCGATRQEEPPPLQEARALRRQRLMGEYRRLLYVGMTRAADRLYLVSNAGPLTKGEADKGVELPEPDEALEASWYQMLRRGLTIAKPVGEIEEIVPNMLRQRLRVMPEGRIAPPLSLPPTTVKRLDLPAWLRQPLPPETLPVSLAPSRTGTPQAGQGEAVPFARRRGIVLHKLFELLPRVAAEARANTGTRLLAALAPDLAPEDRPAFLTPVLDLLAGDIGLRHFGPASRAEVAISGQVVLPCGAAHPVRGRIDRLTIEGNSVAVLDLKTGKPHAASADEAILNQMALYRALLAQLYPAHTIACHVLWLESAQIETLPDPALEAAFARISAPQV